MDLKNTKELIKLIDLIRKKGVTRLKSADFEIELAPSALFPESNYKKKQTEDLPIESVVPFTPEQALFWSSAGIPEELN